MSKCTLQVEAIMKAADGEVIARYQQSTQFPDFASVKSDQANQLVDQAELNNAMQEQLQYGQTVFKELGSHVALTTVWLGSKRWSAPPLAEAPSGPKLVPPTGAAE